MHMDLNITQVQRERLLDMARTVSNKGAACVEDTSQFPHKWVPTPGFLAMVRCCVGQTIASARAALALVVMWRLRAYPDCTCAGHRVPWFERNRSVGGKKRTSAAPSAPWM